MRILVLGGTGAIGTPLVKMLESAGHEISVTSRKTQPNNSSIRFIQGNAKDFDFFQTLMNEKYDVIIDFMVYNSNEFKNRVNILLDNTEQYIFFSSCRVYADSMGLIKENSDRLLDVCKDGDYLRTNEYALEKAREENVLRESNRTNWTIIRPYITYNTERLQLGVFEKENWLYRALRERTVVFPKDIARCITSFTYAEDVAKVLCCLIGNKRALGEDFNIVSPEYKTWHEIFDIYVSVLESILGTKMKVLFLENSDELMKIWNPAQIKYDRLYNRKFDNAKICDICGHDIIFKSMEEGIGECINRFVFNEKWQGLNIEFEAWADRHTKEYTPLKEISGRRNKLMYLKKRFYLPM